MLFRNKKSEISYPYFSHLYMILTYIETASEKNKIIFEILRKSKKTFKLK